MVLLVIEVVVEVLLELVTVDAFLVEVEFEMVVVVLRW